MLVEADPRKFSKAAEIGESVIQLACDDRIGFPVPHLLPLIARIGRLLPELRSRGVVIDPPTRIFFANAPVGVRGPRVRFTIGILLRATIKIDELLLAAPDGLIGRVGMTLPIGFRRIQHLIALRRAEALSMKLTVLKIAPSQDLRHRLGLKPACNTGINFSRLRVVLAIGHPSEHRLGIAPSSLLRLRLAGDGLDLGLGLRPRPRRRLW